MPLPENPLPPCPRTTNCHRESRAFTRPAAVLFADALAAVRTLSNRTTGRATEIERDADGLGLHATFEVLVFTDDLHLRAERHGGGAVLHVRSASRVGRSDLGTNRRRVRALFETIA